MFNGMMNFTPVETSIFVPILKEFQSRFVFGVKDRESVEGAERIRYLTSECALKTISYEN